MRLELFISSGFLFPRLVYLGPGPGRRAKDETGKEESSCCGWIG